MGSLYPLRGLSRPTSLEIECRSSPWRKRCYFLIQDMVKHTIWPLSHIICEQALIWSRYLHSRFHLALIYHYFRKQYVDLGTHCPTLPLRKSRNPLQNFIEIIYKLIKAILSTNNHPPIVSLKLSAPKLKAPPRVWFDNYIWPVCRRKNWYFIYKGFPSNRKSRNPLQFCEKITLKLSQQRPRPCSTKNLYRNFLMNKQVGHHWRKSMICTWLAF